MSKDCPTRGPMVCRSCNEEGHMSKECPTRGPIVCTNCNQEGKYSSSPLHNTGSAVQ